ncbi:MAG: glutathione S-transferase family protein [Hyphomicrobiales bacterium]
MGRLVQGAWQNEWYDTSRTGGRFERQSAHFRNWVTPDGSPGPTGKDGFKAERGRYHLYVSYACPWAHRTLIMRALKGLEEAIGISVVHWFMGENGWSFEEDDGVMPDPIFNARYLHEIYTAAEPEYTGRVTVPVLWDRQTRTIVSNESADIIRMLNASFDAFSTERADFHPVELHARIDEINSRIYRTVNNGVYRAGFATKQEAYDEAVSALFDTLDWLEGWLSSRRWLMGGRFTEADIRLFTTLVRFDLVYYGHFKCNVRRLVDYPNLWGLTREICQMPEIAPTIRVDHIKGHYYMSHPTINPSRIVPAGPDIDFTTPHGRDRLLAA